MGAMVVNCKRMLSYVDTHTEGDLARVVYAGVPRLAGQTVRERRDTFRANFDHLRRIVMCEPRGHKDMFGVVITDGGPSAELGAFFIDTDGYLDACGHGIIAATTVAIELGLVDRRVPRQEVVFDTPAGIVTARAETDWASVSSVSVELPKAFAPILDHKVQIGERSFSIDISYCGNFFAFVDVDAHDLSLDDLNLLRRLGKQIKDELNNTIRLSHPDYKEVGKVDLVEFYSAKAASAGNDYKIALVYGNEQLGRDPCATGTGAKMAIECARGHLSTGQGIRCEGILGTVFQGTVRGVARGAEYASIRPEVTGRTYFTALGTAIQDPADPLAEGWLLV
jgi:proline racemase